MPSIILRTPEGIFDAEGRRALAAAITDAAHAAEQIGDAPQNHVLTWLVIEEVPPAAFFIGGREPQAAVIPILIFFHYPAGVLDDQARAQAVRLIQEAALSARPAGDPRPVQTSVILSETPDGAWGGAGRIWRLPDIAAVAGFKHLQHLTAA